MDRILQLIKKEEKRQRDTLTMIASENYTYPEVYRAVGSALMQKYSEGQPYKRYYQGNQWIDEIEALCKKRALWLFKLKEKDWDVNVQALSGAPANLAIYNALLAPGEKILSLYLPDGGHLSHGWHTKDKAITFVSKIWNVQFYRVDSKTHLINYDEVERTAKKFSPKIIVSGGTAYPREIDHQKMYAIAKKVGAYYLADVSHEAGLIAGGANKSPFPYADVVMMTTHKTLRGPRGALIFSKKSISSLIDQSVFPGLQGGPHNHTIAGIAIALEKAKSLAFQKYAYQTIINAKKLAAELKLEGANLISGGTDKHLVLLDVRPFNVNSYFVAKALEKCGIIVNKNTIPNDTSSAFYPSGVRVGTQALTARGMKEAEMEKISKWIVSVIHHIGKREMPTDKEKREKILKAFEKEIKKDQFYKKIWAEVKKLTAKFPLEK